MPATRITVVLNSKQSQKAPLLIPSSTSLDPAATSSCRDLVIKTAQSKLRLKKATRIFAAGGRELEEKKDWESVLINDVVLLVSAGEEYIGSKKEEALNQGQNQDDHGPSRSGNSNCSINVLADKAFVDPTSITQLETTARSLPGIIHAVAQPDLHPGTKFPIGAVFVSQGWIHPPLIGGDIGCGMAWYKTKLSRSNVEGDKGRKIAERLQGLEGPWRNQQDKEVWLRTNELPESSAHCGAGEVWDASLGTIGAGNHFGELQVVEKSAPANGSSAPKSHSQLYEDEVVLLVHSGSRGYGGDILKRYTADGQTSIHESEPNAKLYLEEHDRACTWASRNRDLIALRFLACLEPGDDVWELGLNNPDSTATAQNILAARAAIQSRKVVDIWHNNVESSLWPPQSSDPASSIFNGPGSNGSEPGASIYSTSPTSSLPPPSKHHQTKVYIHRKGAAPTLNPFLQTPLSILPLPGSRGTPTLILHPTFTAANSYGLTNALSLAHGAGRAMSRAKASIYIANKYRGRTEDLLRGDFVPMDKQGNKLKGKDAGEDVNGGTWVVCEDKQLVWEEAPEAYKDVWAVGADLVGKGCAERLGWCRGRVSYKVRRE